MVKLVLISALLLSFTSCASSRGALKQGGVDVGNGGGASEQNLNYALANIDQSVAFCLHSSSCDLSPKEREILKKIGDSLNEERRNHDLLIFPNNVDFETFFFWMVHLELRRRERKSVRQSTSIESFFITRMRTDSQSL